MPEPSNSDFKDPHSDNAPTRLSKITASSAFKDLMMIAVISVISFSLATEYNAFENLHAFSRQHEDLELDELFTLLMILSVALSIFSFRRIIELRHEVHIRKRAEDKIRKLAYYDNLTGLANRTLLKDRLVHIIAHARRQKTMLAILFIDLDGFKRINDTLGHNYGDEVLKNVAQRMLGAVRDFDTVARLGGDEFIVVLEGVSDLQEINIIAKRIMEALTKHHLLAEQEVLATPSIGISVFPDDGSTCDILIKHADMAMYQSKLGGKGQFQFFKKSTKTGSESN
jgi:diguanylate cyclase (GGDEF)-like protein